jgi:rhodanese-related sulfurtransferase
VSPEDLERRRNASGGLLLMDVRSRREFDQGRLPGAHHVPFWKVLFTRLPEHSEIVVYCGHGPRARIAQAFLALRGVTGVSLLDGHFAAWRRHSRPVER